MSCNSTAESTFHVNVYRELQLELYSKYSALLEDVDVVLVNIWLYYWCCLLCSLLHCSILHWSLLHLMLESLSFVTWAYTFERFTSTDCMQTHTAHEHGYHTHVEQMTATSFSEGKCFLIIINIEVYGDKTTQVSITVSFLLKLTGSPVLTQLRTGPKNTHP